jgi:serine/threonine protein kinase
MRWLSDAVLDHLCHLADTPDLSGTKYELVEKIAQGGMACVYLAKDRELDRPVALKVLFDPPSDPQSRSRMANEARIIARLEHPGIVPIHDSGVLPDGRIYYAMKLVRGKRLDEYVGPSTTRSDLLRIFEKICDAVAFAHAQGVIHRDLKPQNIMVGPFGEVLVMDWGVAKVRSDQPETSLTLSAQRTSGIQGVDSPPTTAHGIILGTPGYMAPEQARGEVERIDERTDVYALGTILYFLLTEQPPAPARSEAVDASQGPLALESPHGPKPSLPHALEAICRKAMATEPGDRYESVQALADDLTRFQVQGRVRAYPEGFLRSTKRWVVKYRVPVVLVLAYLTMRLLVLFLARG